MEASVLVILAVLGCIIYIGWWMLKPKITTFKPVLVAVGPNYLVQLEIGFQTLFPLTHLRIEKKINLRQDDVTIESPEYERAGDGERIHVFNTCCYCEISASYRVTVENIFLRDVSEIIHLYFFPGLTGIITEDGKIECQCQSIHTPEKRRSSSPLRKSRLPEVAFKKEKVFSRHIETQTSFTSLRAVIEFDEKMQRRRKRRKPEEEFTFVNLDPEQCTRCSNVGHIKCKLCLTPYCSARCKTKDHPRHRKECPEMRDEDKQREAKEQEYESCIKSLREDNDRLKEQGLCKVCLEVDAEVVFDPCGHLCCCHGCSKQLAVCPMCRKGVDKPIKVFI